jgi:hypothetical protein
MLEGARPEARTKARSYAQRFSWGIVDLILGVLMLPFAIWMFLIERMVAAVAAFSKR